MTDPQLRETRRSISRPTARQGSSFDASPLPRISLGRRVAFVAALAGCLMAAALATIGIGATSASAAKPASFRVVVNGRYGSNSMPATANDTGINIARTKGKIAISHKTVCLLGK
jgi:hypothetical protein